MRTRQPADQRMDPYVPRTGGTLARSPSERLEPTRPPTRPRRRGGDREPRRSSPFVRFLNGLLAVLMAVVPLVPTGMSVEAQSAPPAASPAAASSNTTWTAL